MTGSEKDDSSAFTILESEGENPSSQVVMKYGKKEASGKTQFENALNQPETSVKNNKNKDFANYFICEATFF